MTTITPAQGPSPYAPKHTAVTFAHDSALFNAAGLTDSATIYTQPANSILLASWMVLDVQFVATGMTDLDITIGNAGDNDGVMVKAMNLTSDAVGTKYETKGALYDATAGTLLKEAAEGWLAYATAVGANLSTTTAGQVTFHFVTIEY